MLTKNVSRIICVAISGLVLLAGTGQVRAQGVGNLGSLPTAFNMNTTVSGWDVGTPTNPIPVVLDPNGPVWRKALADPIGNPFGPPGIIIVPGQPYYLDEHLVIDPTSPSWGDWHEDILTPGWTWSPNTIFLANGVPAPGLTSTNNGTSLSFFFSSLAPGTQIYIHKELVYQGLPGQAFQGFIDILEYPTPEPGSLLLGLASCVFFRRPRRRALNVA